MHIDRLQERLPERVMLELPDTIAQFSLDTPLRLSHFLGQCHHESAGFTRVFENLNYRADTLLKLFPRRIKDPYQAEYVAGNPRLVANTIYYGIAGNIGTEDGWIFRGRGYLQLTGRFNYSEFDKWVPENIVENPDLVATKYPLFSAAWFWHFRRLNNRIEDLSDANIMKITKVVNGGSHGLADRIHRTREYYEILNDN